ELLAVSRIKGQKAPFNVSSEKHISSGCEHRRQDRVLERYAPLLLSGDWIKRVQVGANWTVWRRLDIDIACNKRSAFSRFLRKDNHIRTPLDAIVIQETGSRT